MKEIIEQGIVKRKITTCPECKTVFSFDRADIEEEYNPYESGLCYPPNVKTYVSCPLCGRRVYTWKDEV